jgi:hypothetical protein
MSTRAPRGTAAAKTAPAAVTAESPIPAPVDSALPAAWGTEPVDQFNGHDLTEKKELIDVPFLIIGAEFERNESRGYDVAYVYALDINGTEFEFSDSSTTGVKSQLQAYLTEKGLNPAPGGGFQKMRLVIPRGLRVSEFKVKDEETGKTRTASTYYLTTNGRAAAADAAPQSAPATA